MNIQILDCTLRDGGYVNNWEFGKENISKIAKKLCDAKIDYVECGFLSHTKECSESQSIFSTPENVETVSSDNSKKLAIMAKCEEVDSGKIPPYQDGTVPIIRVAVHKSQIKDAQILCRDLIHKGYRVFLQPTVTLGYSDRELLDLIDWANQNGPEAFYLVDTFGNMRKNDLLRFFYLVDNNLHPNIKIGFHSHNNLQLSFSNAQSLMNVHSDRDIIIDSSVFGMGRGAGNLCTELIAQYINENIAGKYEMLPILEIMDEYIMPIYIEKPWGYSAPYYLAAINNCHPNYATFLMNKQTLCIRDIAAIMKMIPKKNIREYDEKLIAKLYLEFQQHAVDDSELLNELRNICANRKVLVLAPGKSLAICEEKIERFIADESPLVFAINHIPEKFRYDYIFISNLKRFSGLSEAVSKLGKKLICTSNISTEHAVNYSSYLNENEAITDNAGLMLLNVLKKADVHDLYLAGYDGFKVSERENYFDDKMNLNMKDRRRREISAATIEYFSKLKQSLNVTFLTPTIYNAGETI